MLAPQGVRKIIKIVLDNRCPVVFGKRVISIGYIPNTLEIKRCFDKN